MDRDLIRVHKDLTGGVKLEVTRGENMEYARVEVLSGDGHQISRVDASELESHIESQITSICSGR